MDSITPDPRFTNPRMIGPRPPLGGGAPTDEEIEGEAPQEREPQQSTDDSIELPFKLEDVEDETQREWLRSRQAQMQAGYTKKLQEDQASTAEIRELQARLNDPEQQAQALSELAALQGIELEFEEPQYEEPETDPDENPALARLEALEQAEADRAGRDEAERAAREESQFHEVIRAGFDALAEQEGVAVDALPEVVREQVLANAIALPRLENGFLDMSEAVKSYGTQAAFHEQRAKEGYVRSKDTPVVDMSSEAADPLIDLSTKAARLKRAEVVASRHV